MGSTSSKRAYLSTVDIFQDLTPSDMEHLERITAMVTCEAGRGFYNPDEPAEVLFILKRGEVAISRVSPEGKKLIVETLGPGTIFGEMAIIGQRMHQTFAEALTECLICVMSRTDVEKLMLADPRVAMRLVRTLSERLAQAEARIEEIAFKSAPARLASLLLRIATETDWHGRRMLDGLTHQQLAELTGTHRETVTLTLNQFKKAGLVEISRRRITLLDPDRMATIAKA